jgi:hypothetical protein
MSSPQQATESPPEIERKVTAEQNTRSGSPSPASSISKPGKPDFNPGWRFYVAFATLSIITLAAALDATSLSVALPVGHRSAKLLSSLTRLRLFPKSYEEQPLKRSGLEPRSCSLRLSFNPTGLRSRTFLAEVRDNSQGLSKHH